jgi:hypothetical protein
MRLGAVVRTSMEISAFADENHEDEAGTFGRQHAPTPSLLTGKIIPAERFCIPAYFLSLPPYSLLPHRSTFFFHRHQADGQRPSKHTAVHGMSDRRRDATFSTCTGAADRRRLQPARLVRTFRPIVDALGTST